MINRIFSFLILSALLILAGCSTSPRSSQSRTIYNNQQAAVYTPPPVAASPSYGGGVWPMSAPEIHAESAILIDARTGRTLYQKNADQHRQVASTQKLLTGLIIAEREPLDEKIMIASSDTRVEPTKLGLRAGDRYARRDLLEAIMVKSCNDAASALGRDHAGSLAAFSVEMNRTASALGATNSYFVNPHGLPAAQYSTARDMARIAFRAYRNRTLRQMMLVENVAFRHNNGKISRLKATNKLLSRSPIYNGMKTGYTNAAGRCLVTSASSGGRDLILVQLGSKTKYIFDDAEKMIRWGLSRI
ncbi:MAG: D-alanyl-D-alanine carboxypeptidase family protein [Chthoniobacterales bacterium]